MKKLFTSIEKKKERRAALVTEKMPKLGNSYNLLWEACYEARMVTMVVVVLDDNKTNDDGDSKENGKK